MSVSRNGSGSAQLLRVEEVAEKLGVSVRTVWRLTSCGQLAKPVAIGGCTRWRSKDVDAFVESLKSI